MPNTTRRLALVCALCIPAILWGQTEGSEIHHEAELKQREAALLQTAEERVW